LPLVLVAWNLLRAFFCLTCDRLIKIHWDKKHEPSRKQTKGKVSKDQEFAGYMEY
jgi:hypothetical protein